MPEDMGNGIFRIYFSGRNKKNQSHIGYAVVNLNKPYQIIKYEEKPTLLPGELGCFDDNGVTPSCIFDLGNNEKALYRVEFWINCSDAIIWRTRHFKW